jgi:predicted tellurium resistance membrane protein TerC
VAVVKQGWSWPGFLFGFVWAIFKDMYAVGFGVFMALLILTQIGRALGGTAAEVIDLATTIGGALLAVGFGLYGNGLRERHLRNRGFSPRATFSASGARAARKRFLEQRTAE